MAKREHVRLEPCDLPTPEQVDAAKFRLRKTRDGYECCWLCEEQTRVKPFDNGGRCEPGCHLPVMLCEMCSGLQAANAAFYPSQYPRIHDFRDMLLAMRFIVRQELKRSPR